MKNFNQGKVNKIAKNIIAYNENDVANIVRLFVGDKKSSLSNLSKLKPFNFEMKTQKDVVKYNRMFDDFYRDLYSVVEKHRKKFEES